MEIIKKEVFIVKGKQFDTESLAKAYIAQSNKIEEIQQEFIKVRSTKKDLDLFYRSDRELVFKMYNLLIKYEFELQFLEKK